MDRHKDYPFFQLIVLASFSPHPLRAVRIPKAIELQLEAPLRVPSAHRCRILPEPVRFLDTVIQGGLTTSEVVFASLPIAPPRRRNRAPERNPSAGDVAQLAPPPAASAASDDRLRLIYPGLLSSDATNPVVVHSGFQAYSEGANGLPRGCLGSTVWVNGLE